MPTAKASVPTANAAKYVQQLCKHWSHRLEVDLSDRKGVVKFPTAVATLDAGEDALLVTIEGGESRVMAPGDVVVIPPGLPHRFSKLDGTITYLVTRIEAH